MRSIWIFLVATVAGLVSPATYAHELWLHSRLPWHKPRAWSASLSATDPT